MSAKPTKRAARRAAGAYDNSARFIRETLVLKWTEELPEGPGWYWYRNGLYKDPGVLKLTLSDGVLGEAYSDSESCDFHSVAFFSSVCDAQWAGPIEPPEEYTP